MRLQWPQKGSLTGAMMPISPRPSAKAQRLEVAEDCRRDGPQVEARLDRCEQLASGHDHFLLPGARGIQRHELDEAQAKLRSRANSASASIS